jgi:putative sterol carrier protein
MPKFNAEELIQILEKSFVKEASSGVNTTIQLNLSGEGGGDWYLNIKGMQLRIVKGIDEDSDAEITTSTSDLLAILSGSLDPLKAFFAGKIVISGDQSAVVKLLSLFKVNRDELRKLGLDG